MNVIKLYSKYQFPSYGIPFNHHKKRKEYKTKKEIDHLRTIECDLEIQYILSGSNDLTLNGLLFFDGNESVIDFTSYEDDEEDDED